MSIKEILYCPKNKSPHYFFLRYITRNTGVKSPPLLEETDTGR